MDARHLRTVPAGEQTLRAAGPVASGDQRIHPAIRSRHTNLDLRLRQRLERRTSRHHTNGDRFPGRGAGRRRDGHRIDGRQGDPPERLPPERIVGPVRCGQQHPPAPGRFPREDHRPPFTVALYGHEGAGAPPGAASDCKHAGPRTRAAERCSRGKRWHGIPALPRLLTTSELHDRVCLSLGGQPHTVGSTRRDRGGWQDVPAAICPIERKRLLQGGSDEPAAEEGLRAKYEKASAALADEVTCGLQLVVREEAPLHVRKNDRVVREQGVPACGVACRQGCAARRGRLDVKGVRPLVVPALPHDRIDLQAWIAAPRTPEEAVLVPGRPLHQQHAAGTRGRLHEHAPGVVFGHQLAGRRRDLHGVNRGCSGARLDLKSGMNRRAGSCRSNPPQIDRAPILQQPQLDSSTPVAVTHGSRGDVDAGFVEHRLGNGDAENFPVACDRRRSDCDRKHRCVFRSGRAGAPIRNRRLSAVREQDHSGNSPPSIALLKSRQCASNVALPGGRGQRLGRCGREGLPETEHLHRKVRRQCGEQLLHQHCARVVDPAGAPHILDAHAA